MVATNPLFNGGWSFKKFQATVFNDIWPEVTFFTLISLMVTLVSKLTSHKLQIGNALLGVLGTVLGLVISFRTSSAYERYQEGRKMWNGIIVASRNLALMFWIHVPTERHGDQQNSLRAVIEKKSMINLIQAYSVSLKHFLRGEPGVYYADLFPLVSFLPRYANTRHDEIDMLPLWSACHDPAYPHPHHPPYENPREAVDDTLGRHVHRTNSLPAKHEVQLSEDEKSNLNTLRSKSISPKISHTNFDPEQALPEVHSAHPLRPARNPPKTTLFDYFPFLRLFRWIGRVAMRRTRSVEEIQERLRKKLDTIESNVPLEIILVLSGYTNYLMRSNFVVPAIATGMMNNITTLQDTLSNLERIRNTPLPFAYQAHLRFTLWLYLLFLPFQIYSSLGWYTIPGTTFASFLFLGFLEIGQEIENPFNYDLNDLDLDQFCLSLQRELHEVTAFTNPDPATFVFSAWNQPFAPSDRRTASDLVKDGNGIYRTLDNDGPEPGMASIRRTLVDNWKKVDQITRHQR